MLFLVGSPQKTATNRYVLICAQHPTKKIRNAVAPKKQTINPYLLVNIASINPYRTNLYVLQHVTLSL